ncbi:MAG: ribonuclease HII [Ruminococcus flavefaciens]|nr:ribonuclease HII [Ruminococcus flavefaciens]MCM1229760.1 ribonuclease HII [Ruminococcus flavefaciens]
MAKIILHKELFDYDSEMRKSSPILCGVDEAGRGPLAGDVYAAAVILSDGVLIDYLNDSKKISESRREKLYDEIIEKAEAYCVAVATVEEIDRLNILQATMLAMKRAVDGLGIRPNLALIDGNRLPELDCPAQFVVKGDAKSASIAAASVLAKVSRDRYMKDLAEKYPEYRFEQHKGYGTALHREMLVKYGASEVHRKTFLRKILGENNDGN